MEIKQQLKHPEQWDYYEFAKTLVRKQGEVYKRCAISKTPRLNSIYHNTLLIADDGKISICPDNCKALTVGNLIKIED